jgi:hypothetical protein
MVESIWWVEGLLEHSFPRYDNEVGEGWLVLAKPEALALIMNQYPLLERILEVKRQYYNDEGRLLRRSASEIIPMSISP